MHKAALTTENISIAARASTLRSSVFRVLETAEEHDSVSRVVDLALVMLIIASVIAVLLESVPSIESKYSEFLAIFEAVTIGVFSVEFLLRLWSSVEAGPDAAAQPWLTRLRYLVSFHAVIDMLAILPFYLLLYGVVGVVDMRFLRAIRLLRVLKLMRYSPALNMLFTTFRENGRALAAAFLILITVMLLAASGMYYFERDSQPEDFGSIPAAMWWAFATLTTVGYGDVTPITAGGKIFGALITVVGIGMVALPTSILASGYNRQLNISTAQYASSANEALDDGILSDDEVRDLEALRIDLGIGKHAASQILDEKRVSAALRGESVQERCPSCQQQLPIVP